MGAHLACGPDGSFSPAKTGGDKVGLTKKGKGTKGMLVTEETRRLFRSRSAGSRTLEQLDPWLRVFIELGVAGAVPIGLLRWARPRTLDRFRAWVEAGRRDAVDLQD